MTANKLQEAISLIRSGDKEIGQKLLTEILNAEPGNETAWLWMGALMSGEKRKFCLEKVLSINPHHAQAREQLVKMTSAVPPPAPAAARTVAVEPPAPRTPSAPVNVRPTPAPQPEVAPAASYVPVQGTPLPKVWLIPGKHLASIIYLEGNNLLAFDVLPDKASEVLEEVRLGVTQKQFDQIKDKFHLMNVSHALLSKVTSVTLFGDALKIIGVDKSDNEKKINTTVNKENAEAVLKALHERLGPDFQRNTRPISRLRVMMSAIVLFTITVCGTGFFWRFVRGLQAEVEAEGMGGSARARGIAALLLLIGPNGFLCIGSLALIVVIVAMISSLRKPPEEIVLARGAGSEKSS